MRTYCHILILASAIVLNVPMEMRAQQQFDNLIDSNLTVRSDIRLNSLVMRHVRANRQKDGFEGFRVQLFSGSGNLARQNANNLRAEYLSIYPEATAYLIYQAPNFKVRVGDFRTRLEAVRWQRELSYQFPEGFVVKDMIKFPKLDIDKETNDDPDLVPEDVKLDATGK